MRVGICIRAWARERPTGKGIYTAGLIRALVALGEPLELVLLKRVLRPWPARIGSGVRRRRWVGGPAAPLDRFRNRDLDLVHHPDSRLVVPHRGPAVLTLHDVEEIETGRAAKGPRYRTRVERKYEAIERVRPYIVTDTAYALAEIRRHLAVDEARVRVVPAGVDARFRPPAPEEVQRVRGRHGLPGPYVLFVGGYAHRKNGPRVLEAFAGIARRVPDVVLAVVGKRSEALVGDHAAVLGAARARVRVLGFVADADLVTLYGGAALFLWPSLHEGFGLPVLEAMACGAPVVSSTAAAIPEVAGDAAILVDPTAVQAMTEAALAVLGDPARAARLREAGLARARGYTWERTAREMLGVYREAVAGRRS